MSATETVLDHYIACALWSSHDDDGPLDEVYSRESLSVEALDKMREDVVDFIQTNGRMLAIVLQMPGYELENVGHDFWLTRNGHGAGFWDRYYGDDELLKAAFTRLTEMSKPYGECTLYVGDDGALHVA